MKNFKIAFIALLALVISSCGDDEGPGFEFNQENIAGTYTFTFFESNETIVETLSTGSQITTTIDTEGDTFGSSRLTLNDNGSYSTTGDIRVTVTTRTGNQPSETDPPMITSIRDNGTFSLNEDDRTLILNSSTGLGITEYDVTRFSNSRFTIESEEVETDTDFESTTVTEIRLERVN